MTHPLRWTCHIVVLTLVLAGKDYGSVASIGETGINSVNIPYTGKGISIGQVEPTRPGTPKIDDGSHSNFFTTPKEVYLLDGRINPTPNAA